MYKKCSPGRFFLFFENELKIAGFPFQKYKNFQAWV